ncbi:MAG: LptF/LptG family permease [Treponema sp.]
MKQLYRRRTGHILFLYIAKEMTLYFIVCFLFFFFIFFVNNILLLAEDILSKKAPFKDVALLMIYALPSVIANASPFAALVGTLMGIGRFVSDLEFLSMNALGVSTRFIMVPVLLVGVIISLLSFFTNDVLLPAGAVNFRKVYWDIATSTPALELESYSIKRNENAVVISGLIKDNHIHNLLIIDTSEDKSTRILGTEKALIGKSPNPSIVMSLSMQEPCLLMLRSDNKQNYDAVTGERITYNVLAKSIKSAYFNSIGPSEMSSLDLYKDVQEKKAQNEDRRLINIYEMELHKKFSIPFGAFFFVLLAFAISSAGKVHSQSVGFIIGLLIAVVYWALFMGGQTLSLRLDWNGSAAMWLPNAMLLLASVILLGKKLLK